MKTRLRNEVRASFTDLITLFDNGQAWIKGVYARKSKRGESVTSDDPQAACWCLAGGIEKLDPSAPVRDAIRDYLRMAVPKKWVKKHHTTSYVAFNDARTTKYPDIRRLLLRARRLVGTKVVHV